MSLIDLTNDQEQSFEVLPAGKYLVRCTEAKVEDTKSGTGQFITCQLQVLEGPHESRKLFTRFNIKNDSEQAQKIGRGQLKGFLTKSGFKDPNKLEDVNHLCGLEAVAHVAVRTSSEYGDQNDIKYFKTKAESEKAGDKSFAPTEETF